MFAEMVEQVVRRDWSHTTELLAQLVERVDLLLRVTVMAHSDPQKRPSFGPPYRVRRPGEEEPKPTVVRPGEFFRMLRG